MVISLLNGVTVYNDNHGYDKIDGDDNDDHNDYDNEGDSDDNGNSDFDDDETVKMTKLMTRVTLMVVI